MPDVAFNDPTVPFNDPTVPFNGLGGPSPLPFITSLSTQSGPDTGGTTVTVNGGNFGKAATPSRFTSKTSGFSQPIFQITADIPGFLAKLAATGATHLRTDAYWALLQPTNSHSYGVGLNVDFDAGAVADLDAVVNGCHALGIHVTLMAGFTPSWARPGHSGSDKIPPTRDLTGYGDYAYFVWWLANRYGNKITIEIWNEANISTFWQQPASTSTHGAVDSPDAYEYAKLLKAGHIAVKTGIMSGRSTALAAHPEVLILTAGTSPASGSGGGDNYGPADFLTVVLAQSVENFDHVAHHPYQWQWPPTGTQTWNGMHQTLDLRALMLAAGRADADIWATEVGIISRPNASGTNAASPNGVGGYDSGAPGGAYNTSSRAINYTLSTTRASQYLAAWTASDKVDNGRQFTGPFCIFKLIDTAVPGAGGWSDDEDHYGGLEQSGTAKPHETTWENWFAANNASAASAAPGSAANQLSVSVCGVAATIKSSTDTTIVIQTGASATDGTGDVVVTTSAGSSATGPQTKFTYTTTLPPPSAPVITKLSPSFGSIDGGYTITATGTGMTGMVSALFGASSATFDLPPNDTTLVLHVPAHAAAVVDVRLTNAAGQSGISGADQFRYVAPNPPPPPNTRKYTLYARNAAMQRAGQIEDHTAASVLLKWLSYGTFTVTLPFPSTVATELLQPNAGIIVEVDGVEQFSGPVRARLRSEQGGVSTLTVSGVSDDFWLWARAAHPQPNTAQPPYYQQVADIRTGVASTIIGAYVNVNLGPAALSDRRVPALTIGTDPLAGGTLTGQARWQTLGTLLTQLALAAHPQLGFRVLQSGNALVFSVVVPKDRSASVVFSEDAGTLGDFSYERDASNANYVYALGAGANVGRIVVEDENGADIGQWGRVEEVLSRSDLGGPVTDMVGAMNGQHFPPFPGTPQAGFIFVESVAGFPTTGQILVFSENLGLQLVTYTGTITSSLGNAFTGCTGGSPNATMQGGHQVVPLVDDTGQLEQAIKAELAQQTDTFRTDLTIVDTAAVSWPTSYGLGDIVSVLVDGVTLVEQVRALQLDLGPGDTVKVTPSVSSPSPKATVREQSLFSLVRDLQQRLSNVERNQ